MTRQHRQEAQQRCDADIPPCSVDLPAALKQLDENDNALAVIEKLPSVMDPGASPKWREAYQTAINDALNVLRTNWRPAKLVAVDTANEASTAQSAAPEATKKRIEKLENMLRRAAAIIGKPFYARTKYSASKWLREWNEMNQPKGGDVSASR